MAAASHTACIRPFDLLSDGFFLLHLGYGIYRQEFPLVFLLSLIACELSKRDATRGFAYTWFAKRHPSENAEKPMAIYSRTRTYMNIYTHIVTP